VLVLGWIAGEIIVSDPVLYTHLPYDERLLAQIAKPLLAVLVMVPEQPYPAGASQTYDVVDLAAEDQK